MELDPQMFIGFMGLLLSVFWTKTRNGCYTVAGESRCPSTGRQLKCPNCWTLSWRVNYSIVTLQRLVSRMPLSHSIPRVRTNRVKNAVHATQILGRNNSFRIHELKSHENISHLQQISTAFQYGYGSVPINTIFSGMNIHFNQLFWCSPGVQGFDP